MDWVGGLGKGPFLLTFSTVFMLKFGLSENCTKFENVFLVVLTNRLIYLVNVKNHEEDFFKLCVLLKKSEL